MTKRETLIKLNDLEKQNRRNRLEDKLKQQEYYGEIEELFDPLNKTLFTNSETWQAHAESMLAPQNKTLAALDSNTNALKSLGHHQGTRLSDQQSSFLDERAALLTPSPDPPVTLKDDRGETFAVDNDMIDILLEMGKQKNKQTVPINIS